MDSATSVRSVVVRAIPPVRHHRFDESIGRNSRSRYKGAAENSRSGQTRSSNETHLRRRDGPLFGPDAETVDEVSEMDGAAVTLTAESRFNRTTSKSERDQIASRFIGRCSQGRQRTQKRVGDIVR